MQFCVASAIVDKKIVFDTFEIGQVERDTVQRLSDKVIIETDESQAPVVIDSGGHVDVSIIMQDGKTFDRRIEQATGTPAYPLSDSALQDKFRDCASTILDSTEIDKAISIIYSLETLPSVIELMRPFRTESKIHLGT